MEDNALGLALRKWRKAKGLSQSALAHKVKITKSYVSNLENGERRPSLDVLGRLATALGVEPATLLLS